jgi:signal transduction histidine kinase
MRLLQLVRSASFRLAAAYVVLFGLSVLVLGSIAYVRVMDQFDREARLRIEAEGDALLYEFNEAGLEHLLTVIQSRHRNKLTGGLDYVVYDVRGKLYAGNHRDLPFKAGWETVTVPPDGDEPPGEMERLTVLAVPLSDTLWLAIGDDLVRIDTFGQALLGTFVWVGLLSATLAIVGGIVLSALFLGRVSAITNTAEAIIGGDIKRRVPRRRANDELDRLAATLNRMLDRITSLMEALRHVSSSIAHELRTPLAHLRQTLEGARVQLPEGAATGAVDEAIAEVDSVLSTFSALLRIAQIESGTRRQGFRAIDLSSLLESIVQTFTPIAEDSDRVLIAAIDPRVVVSGDAELLTLLVVNVIENALRHTPEGTPIELRLKGGSCPVMTVSDRGQGIPASAHAQIFDRFHRLEASSGVPGSGLGLSMVGAVAELHGIAIELGDNGPGLIVRFVFPAQTQLSVPQSDRRERSVAEIA